MHSFRTITTALPILGAVVISACSGGESTSVPAAANVQATTTTTLTAVVGSAVSPAPSVRVLSSSGAPVAGTKVTFSVGATGGSVGQASATTGSDGVASAGSWTLGTTAGTNTLDAAVSGLTPVRFTATATAAAAASLSVSAGDNQSAALGTTVATAPAVVVRDQYGNPVAGATVTFSVETGGGSVTGASVTTGADGIARVGSWLLGITSGAQRIKATSGTLSATINANATIPAGCTTVNYALGVTLPMNWDADDCTTTGGVRYDRLSFTTTAQQQIDAVVTGANGRTIRLKNSAGMYVGLQPGTAFSPPTQNPMHMKYVLAPGTYQFEPYAPDAATTGAYTFSTTTGTKIDCDYIIFASTNVTINGTVDNTSCVGPGNGREQWFNLQLKTGTKVRITLSGTDNVPYLLFRDDRLGPASPTLVTAKGTTAGETVTVNWTATFDTWHEIVITSLNGLLGKYTLKIEELP
jgi:hypothetical protein